MNGSARPAVQQIPQARRSGPVIGLLHPGQMGAAVAALAVHTGHEVWWDPAGRSPHSARRAGAAGLQEARDLSDLADRVDVLLSICPPAAAGEVARRVAGIGFRGLYVEANAISPHRVECLARTLQGSGATFLDGSIVGVPPTDDRGARLYLAGPPEAAQTLAAVFAGTTLQVEVISKRPGAASALKMAFAGYQKATRILAGVSHALAAEHGVSAQLLAEAQRHSRSPLADPDYLPSVAARAWRWAPELREVADTLDEAGLPSHMAQASARAMQRWTPYRDRWDCELTEILHALVQRQHQIPTVRNFR
jgi:3-hydroxyisobutyrate dehydrogenase-like beta-hydroxyacid dehydrogenase